MNGRDELSAAEEQLLTDAERKTLADLRHDALSGPPMFEDAVALIERLVRRLGVARGALADIAFSDDLRPDGAKAKAKRVYEETA